MLLTVPETCMERIIGHLDFLSTVMLASTCTRFRPSVLVLWTRTRTPPTYADELVPVELKRQFVAAASSAIAGSALHTPHPQFQYASVVPNPLSLRDACAALDLSSVLRHLPAPRMGEVLLGTATEHAHRVSHTGARGGSKGSRKRGPPPKISPLIIAVLTRSPRAVEALLDEAGRACDPVLSLANPDGRIPRLDLSVRRLPSAHLGQYVVTRRRDDEVKNVLPVKDITVRVLDDPEASHSSVYACAVQTRSCVNTTWLLEMALLIHEPRVCELLLKRTSMHAPRYSIIDLLNTQSLCGASFARLGAEHTPESPVATGASIASDESALEGSDSEAGEVECLVSFCPDLESCAYVRNSLRIARAFLESSRLSCTSTDASLADVADFGDVEMLHRLVTISERAIAAISQRQQWRSLYEAVKTWQLEESVGLRPPGQRDGSKFRRVAAWHGCLSHKWEAGSGEEGLCSIASRDDMERKIRPFIRRVAMRRGTIVKCLSCYFVAARTGQPDT